MPPRSAFDQHFSRQVQHQLAAWLDQHPTCSVDEFRDLLAERGLQVGRTTAHKEKTRLEQMGDRLRRSQDLMEGIGASLEGRGDASRNRALVEAGRTLVFELGEQLLEVEAGEQDPDAVSAMTLSIQRVIRAARQAQDFGALERAELRSALESKLDAADGDLAQGADPAEVIARVRREVYGILDD